MSHLVIVPQQLPSAVKLPSYGPANLATVRFSSMDSESFRFQALAYEPSLVDPSDPLVLVVETAGEEKILRAPETIRPQLASYLNSPRQEKDSDCYSFAHAMMSVPYSFGKGIFLPEWDHYKITTAIEVPAGKALLQWQECLMASPGHLSISLGEGLFISKAGEGSGPLIIADIKTMQVIWGGDTLAVLDNYKGPK